jgi:hypothetical protein
VADRALPLSPSACDLGGSRARAARLRNLSTSLDLPVPLGGVDTWDGSLPNSSRSLISCPLRGPLKPLTTALHWAARAQCAPSVSASNDAFTNMNRISTQDLSLKRAGQCVAYFAEPYAGKPRLPPARQGVVR